MTTTSYPPELPATKKPRGCLFWGCIISLILLVVGGIGGYFLITYLLDKVVEVVQEYTETSPMELPATDMPAAEYELLAQRVRQFGEALKADQPTEPLVLTSADLNALIAKHPAMEGLRGKLHVDMVGDQLNGDVAMPLDPIIEHLPGMSRLKGRYLNGRATLKAVLVDDILVVSLRSLTVKGESLPPEVLAELSSRNLVAEQQAGPEFREIKAKVESLRVIDGKLTIVGKTPK